MTADSQLPRWTTTRAASHGEDPASRPDHMAPLDAFVDRLRGRHGEVPGFDALDGGIKARLLLLLETPGPGLGQPRRVSRDNPTGTGRNLRRFLDEAEWPRGQTILWNAVPWVIHGPGALNRAPKAAEIAAGLAELPEFLQLLPSLRAVVLAGRVTGRAAPVVAAVRPDLPIFTMPHPSPVYVCTDPAIAIRIRSALTAARAAIGGEERADPSAAETGS